MRQVEEQRMGRWEDGKMRRWEDGMLDAGSNQ